MDLLALHVIFSILNVKNWTHVPIEEHALSFVNMLQVYVYYQNERFVVRVEQKLL